MRSINIDLPRLITLAVSNGAISPKAAADAIRAGMNPATKLPITQHAGHFRTEHGLLGSMFLATDKDTGALRKSEDGKRVRFNFRVSAAKSQQAQTPGTVLPQGQVGAPALDQQSLVALVQALAAGQVPAAQPQAQVAYDEADFSDIEV